jgi:hypothetical protein
MAGLLGGELRHRAAPDDQNDAGAFSRKERKDARRSAEAKGLRQFAQARATALILPANEAWDHAEL